jgi:hypothetical protein
MSSWTGAHCLSGSVDPDLFFERKRSAQAIAVCEGCPQRIRCRQQAVAFGEKHGVWGGEEPKERWREWSETGGRPTRLDELMNALLPKHEQLAPTAVETLVRRYCDNNHDQAYHGVPHSDACALCERTAEFYNVQRQQPLATHCKNGHEFTHQNTFVESNLRRSCVICRKDRVRRNRLSQRGLAA